MLTDGDAIPDVPVEPAADAGAAANASDASDDGGAADTFHCAEPAPTACGDKTCTVDEFCFIEHGPADTSRISYGCYPRQPCGTDLCLGLCAYYAPPPDMLSFNCRDTGLTVTCYDF